MPINMSKHQHFLQLALAQAERGQGFCAPNPAVGAVIVRDEQVIARGYHAGPGQDHAEVMALKYCEQAQGATLYVTLEPCCHYGRTPPCTTAIIAAGITHVYFAVQDPNRHVSAQGQAVLRQAGIVCEQIDVSSITEFYHDYIQWLQTGKASVTAKLALSFDGKIAAQAGKPIAISGPKLKQYTHQQRLKADAIMTTAQTIIADDPQLNVRLSTTVMAKPLLVVDRQARLPLSAQVFKTAQSITLFHADGADTKRLQALQNQGVHCVALDSTAVTLDLSAIVKHCGKLGYHSVWLEAGGQLTQAMLQQHLLDTLILYISPVILGKQALPAFSQALDFAALCRRFFVKID